MKTTHARAHAHKPRGRRWLPVAGVPDRMSQAAFILLLCACAECLSAGSLNAPQGEEGLHPDGTSTSGLKGVDKWRRPLLDRTRPFAVINRQKRSLMEALQDGHPDRLQCGLEVSGRLFILNLEKNRDLLPNPPNIFYYLPNGTGVSVRAGPVTHCYYHGSVLGFPESRVAVSTCSGLRGVVTINSSLAFEVQPLEDYNHPQEDMGEVGGGSGGGSDQDLHLLFSTDTSEGNGARSCGVSHAAVPPIHSSSHMRRSKRDILSETKYIELVLVADHQEFLNFQRNNKTIIYRLLDVANQVDWYYRPLNVRVALTGMEIWSDQDKISVEKNPTSTLNNFLEWRTRDLLPRFRHDNAQLIMGGSFDGTTVGMASQSSMCSRDRSGGVSVDHLVSVLGVASTIAHELGHNLGMSHDTAERRCACQNEPRLGGCIMEPSTGFLPGQQFSSCSAADLSVSLLHGGGMCLFNMPRPERLLGGPRCGNLYVEKGEQCDCGLIQDCKDPCCNASTCQLVPGAQCSSDGICCHNCKLRLAGSVCRQPLGECDLPEFCTGTSPHCPPNVFLQNGEPCQSSTSFCHGGVCANMNTQCQMLWGPNATSAPDVCFSSVNKQGNKYGNCGQLTNGSYIPCAAADVRCGRIQCRGGRERPLLGTNAEILTTTFNHTSLVCRGTFFHLADDVSDPATVAQGTTCGPGKACLDQKCTDVSVFGVDDCRSKCHHHGVCNSNRNCHCDVGWAPPDCRSSGLGGSVDSGPATAAAESDPVRAALLVIFFLVLPLVLFFLVLRLPRVRRQLAFITANSLMHKSRRHNRTASGQRADGRNGEQVHPLRYHLNPPTDIALSPPHKEVHQRPAPPTKPLPPDPALTPPPQLLVTRPAPPTKPLPPDPVKPAQLSQPRPVVPIKPCQLPPLSHPHVPPGPSHPTTKPSLQAAASAAPIRRPPVPPIRPNNPWKVDKSFV
ncbi:disintegrin and metalloproteinase domain-containing protein 15 isoform X4 [Takifugu flavidus]|uniref:disintegrin and metalloproteinase domain-containing protein 15 isoform X4 n=1 Tax=Takifugu flavidus TaxID=433684 RepID=UPI0025442327|nr:disintegrin and metalloproteinase domain-containing protein 15 isoform X4 [Takifugu flavidus]